MDCDVDSGGAMASAVGRLGMETAVIEELRG